MKDSEGTELREGHVVAYGSREGNSSKLRIGRVTLVSEDRVYVRWLKWTDRGCPEGSNLSKAACLFVIGPREAAGTEDPGPILQDIADILGFVRGGMVSPQQAIYDIRAALGFEEVCIERDESDEARRRLQAKLDAIYQGIGAVLCGQNYWTADEVNEAVSAFLGELP